MTTLLIYTDRSGVFGAEQVDHGLVLAFQRAGFRVVIAQPKPKCANPLVDERTLLGISHYWLPDENIYNWREPDPSLTDPAPAERCFAEIKPELVLFTDSFPFSSLAAKEVAMRLGIAYLVLVHCVQPEWAVEFAPFLSRLPGAYAGSREVVAVSSENLDQLHRVFGLPEGRGRVILNGRPEVFFSPRNETVRQQLRAGWGVSEDDILALSVGRIDWSKGYDRLLEALPLLRRCPHWSRLHFMWAGSGYLDDKAARVVRLLGGGRVKMLGVRNDVPNLLDAADLLVHPARFEGMPLAVLEAMAKGLPIVATAVSGIPEALGEAGILLAPPEINSDFRHCLATAICDLAGDAGQRHQLGRSARLRAEALFTEAHSIHNWLELIHQTLAVA